MIPLTPSQITVLHVDDEAEFTTLTKASLEREFDELRVVSTTSAEAGLERLGTGDIDCVVLDYWMPTMDGLEFLTQVRKVDEDLPVIFFTGRGNEEVASEAITAGTTDYLLKGDDRQFHQLGERILTLVGRARADQFTLETLEHIRAIFDRIGDGVVSLDDHWRITYLNQAAEDLFDEPGERAYNRVFWDAFPAFADTDFATTVRESVDEGESTSFETYVESMERWLGVITYPSEDGITLLVRDLTTARELASELERTREELLSTTRQFNTLRQKVSRPRPPFR